MGLQDRDYYGEKFWELIEEEERKFSTQPRKPERVYKSNFDRKFNFGKFFQIIAFIFSIIFLIFFIVNFFRIEREKPLSSIKTKEVENSFTQKESLSQENSKKLNKKTYKLEGKEIVMEGLRFQIKEMIDHGDKIDDLYTIGKFIQIKMIVENIGKETKFFPFPALLLHDQKGRKYHNSTEATFLAGERDCSLKRIQPGFPPTECWLTYEVPKDVEKIWLFYDGVWEDKEIELGNLSETQ